MLGRKGKKFFSITDAGRTEFQAWLESSTANETPRNEFLLKLFFVKDEKQMIRLFEERVEKVQKTYDEYKKIEERLEKLGEHPRKTIRLISLRYGIAQLALEMNWLKEGILEHAHR